MSSYETIIHVKSISEVPSQFSGKACINEDMNIWYWNGKQHREDGPAVENNDLGLAVWYFQGVLHNINGPARVGKQYIQHWLHGIQVSEKEHKDFREILISAKQKQLPCIHVKTETYSLIDIPSKFTGVVVFSQGSRMLLKFGHLMKLKESCCDHCRKG